MPCGHTCGACPTKSTCHLHDAIDENGEAREFDIEDLAKPPAAAPGSDAETRSVHVADAGAAVERKGEENAMPTKDDKESKHRTIVLEA